MKSPMEHQLDRINQQLAELEAEWDRLDSQGTATQRQNELADQIEQLESRKKFIEEYLEHKGSKDE